MSSSNTRKRHEPWRNVERHYCNVCNVWMGSDKHSISLHESGKKHKENVEKALEKKRRDKVAQEKQQNLLQQTLQQINASAHDTMYTQDAGFYGRPTPTLSAAPSMYTPAVIPSSYVSNPVATVAAAVPTTTIKQETNNSNRNQDRQEWQSRKRQRQEEKVKKEDQDDSGDDDNLYTSTNALKKSAPYIAPDEGYYEYDNRTYLEGTVYGAILEADMPVQYWTGHDLASDAEKRLSHNHHYWKDAIIANVRQKTVPTDDGNGTMTVQKVVDVSYLQSIDDTDETIVKAVMLDRIRIVLGVDESIPDTVEEARLLAMGGEEIVVLESNDKTNSVDTNNAENSNGLTAEEIEEAKAMTGWKTVRIQRTAVRAEIQQERAEARRAREAAALQQQKAEKERQARKMEEAKVANADDSALGAYDIYSQTKHGYKGVDIHAQGQADDVYETSKKLSAGNKGSIGFKKTKKKIQNRRTTTSDD